jgi:hypothetical protein
MEGVETPSSGHAVTRRSPRMLRAEAYELTPGQPQPDIAGLPLATALLPASGATFDSDDVEVVEDRRSV